MNSERIIRLLETQLRLAKEQNRLLSDQVKDLTAQVEALTESLESLSAKFLTLAAASDKEKETKKSLSKLLFNKSEKVVVAATAEKKEKPSLKERGNNGARHRDHFLMEVRMHDVYPDLEDFDPQGKKPVRTENSIRYEYIPPRFIKHIYQLHYYSYQGSMVSGRPPAAPLLNSRYDASFFAGILQMRFLYSMPVERIIKLFGENGFDLSKPAAHHLVKRAAQQFDYLEEVLRQAILEDEYIHMDETYYTILETPEKSTTGKASTKGYIWAAQAHNRKLVQFFYRNGSRSRKVLTGYLTPHYHGAIQSDGLSNYKILQTDEYPHVIRLGCLQHCKRKFLDMEGDQHARDVVDIMNRLYLRHREIPPDSSPEQRLKYKEEHAPPLWQELERKLLEIKSRKTTLPKSRLAKAVNYTLAELPALVNYTRNAQYELDNNVIERTNRYISLSRKNSLFCGSHQGAKRAALIYSLACSCRLNGINSFDYFKDLINKLIDVNPNTDKKYLRTLLPDKWNK